MDRKVLVAGVSVIAVLAVMFIAGFLAAASMSSSRTAACTEMWCSCEGVEGERPCNTCYKEEPVFILGIINVIRTFHGTEIITCENNEKTDSRIEFEEGDCTYNWYFFGTSFPGKTATHVIQK